MEKNNKDTAKYCSCENCQGGMNYHYHYFWLRCFLVVVIIFMVFGLGLKVGEYQGFFEAERDSGLGTYGRMQTQMPIYHPTPMQPQIIPVPGN